MEKDLLTRKLAVILHADVVGSTALVQINETIAHERIHDAFQRFSQTITQHNGTTQEIRGDALVAEFSRASDAVTAALDFQFSNTKHNAGISDQILPILRIGMAMGEVVVADNTITGEGVVLAQRLEQLAKPGGVVVQGAISETVPIRMPFEFESLGEHELKGFEQPIRAFAVRLKLGEELPTPNADATPKNLDIEDLEVPDEPSIAVLPFTNMSSDPEQEFFSDGITEDIITALSKISALLVIARNSTLIYKDQAIDIKQVGREQGVRYVLEGSVRKVGNRLRITAQLIDASTGHHLWAEHYDRDLEDIFALQDEITQKVVSALDVHLVIGEQANLWSSGTVILEAWECVRRGWDLLGAYREDDLPEVKRLLQRAIDLDPKYAGAWAILAGCHFHISDNPRNSKEERKRASTLTLECAQQAIKFDPTCSKAFATLGVYHLNLRKYDMAVQYANKAVEMSPNHANDHAIAAIVLNKCGNPEKALEHIRRAMRLSPVYPMWFRSALGQVTRVLGKTDESIDVFRGMIKRDMEHIEGHIGLAGTLGEVGRIDEAKSAASQVLRINSDFSISEYVGNLSYRDPGELTRIQIGLRNAGLPE